MSIRLTRRAALVSSAAAGIALPSLSHAQTGPAPAGEALAQAVDAYVRQVMAAFPDQPAVSVAVVKTDEAVLTRGYGVRALGGAVSRSLTGTRWQNHKENLPYFSDSEQLEEVGRIPVRSVQD